MNQRALAADLGWSQSEVNRLEQDRFTAVPIVRLCEVASVLGLEFRAALYPLGDGLRDQGHQALISRLLYIVAPAVARSREGPFPNVGDRRSWDLVLRVDDVLVGVECETRIRDLQALVRRIRERERDGGADEILVVLADTRHNRAVVDQFREALGSHYATSPRRILAALRAGTRLPGSGVILV